MTRRWVGLSFAVTATAIVVTGNPVARHGAHQAIRYPGHLVRSAWLHRPVGHPAQLETAVGDASDPAMAPAPDQRFADRPASTVTASLEAVRPDGFVALPVTVDAKGVAAGAWERAVLANEPATPATPSPALDIAFAGAHQAIALYRKGSLAEGDEFGKAIADPALRTTLEWVAVRYNPRDAGLKRLQGFVDAHPGWPTQPWLERRIEEVSLETASPASIKERFTTAPPRTFVGRLALARADLATADAAAATAIVRDIWRNADFDQGEEAAILKEFGALIGRDDHKYRADRLLYKEQVQPALRAASLAGPDVRLLAAARASVIGQSSAAVSDAAVAAVPKAFANDPGLIFARIQRARRADLAGEAAQLMAGVTQDPALLIDGDAWWVERRLIARKLLDLQEPAAAYELCAQHAASSDASTIEAEFHAGWIALRFLDRPLTAATHFARAAASAQTPISRSRASYWQARAAEAAGDRSAATTWYEQAASQPISFYGQLASSKLGRTTLDLRQPTANVDGADRREAIRVVEQLYALGERDIALPLALEIAKTESSDAQVASLAAVLTRANDARATLLIGKLATQRGLAIDEAAFPTFGIPGYEPLTNSADRAVVYAIARQESEFNPQSVSSAGAKGLMQLMGATARQTATKYGLTYDDARLLNDASFNARLGAAHLGQLLAEQRGSFILTFAAYNAGGQRVKDWIAAYGDPRSGDVDPVDWIERIPFTETRNYVQRVFENLQIYRVRFGQNSALLLGLDSASRGKGT